MRDELRSLLTFVLELLADYGLDDYYLELSTPTRRSTVGTDENWAVATETLAQVARESGLDLVDDPVGPRSTTARRSPCRRGTRSAGPGRCRPSS